MNKIKVISLLGETGSGKSTIQKWIVANTENANKIISYTSRPKRDYEKNGKDYFFISEEEFGHKLTQGIMLEAIYLNHWFYGTSEETLKPDKLNVGVFNIKGTQMLLQNSDIECVPILVTAPDKIRLQRVLARESNPDCNEICRRFLADKEDFSEIPFGHVTYMNVASKQKFLTEYWPVLLQELFGQQ